MNTSRQTRRRSARPCPLTPDLFTSVSPVSKQIRLPVPVFGVRLVRERDHLTERVTTPADAARVASELLDGHDREAFLVLALSTAGRLIGAHVAHVGTLDASVASPREVFKFALLVNARQVVLAHNHPSGNVEPSRADVAVSKQMKEAGEVLAVPVVDSLILGFDGEHVSLAERGLI
jgi:DNA repair protein RadC